MSTYSSIIGNYEKITKPSMDTLFGNHVYMYMTAAKDHEAEKAADDSLEMYETVEQFLNPKGNKEKYTFNGKVRVARKGPDEKSIKDERGRNIYDEVEGEHPVKKYVTVNTDVKKAITFMYSRYIHEIRSYYEANKFSFPEENLLSSVANYSFESMEPSFASFVINLSNKMPGIDKVLNDDLFSSEKIKNINDSLKAVTNDYFKSTTTPTRQIALLIEQFVRFLKVTSKLANDKILMRRGVVDVEVFFTCLRHMYTFVGEGLEYPNDFVTSIRSFLKDVKERKAKETKEPKEPKKPRKTKAVEKDEPDEEQNEDEEEKEEDEEEKSEEKSEEEEEEKPVPQKKTPAKTAAKQTPAKKTKKTVKKVVDDDEEFD